MQKPSLNVSQKELFTSCVAFARHTSFLYCEIVLADRLYCNKFLCFVFASLLQSDHYGKSIHRTVTAISHCQHSHNVIHSFRSSTKSKTFLLLNFCLAMCAVLSQRAQIKSIKQMKFLSKQTQNRWKFVIATVRGGCKL